MECKMRPCVCVCVYSKSGIDSAESVTNIDLLLTTGNTRVSWTSTHTFTHLYDYFGSVSIFFSLRCSCIFSGWLLISISFFFLVAFQF